MKITTSITIDVPIMQEIIVWFSCGAASAVAAKRTIEKYGKYNNVRLVNNPIKEEDDDNRRFLKDCEEWLGQKIETATNPDFPNCSADEVWRKRNFISGPHGAPCTTLLKKGARLHFENNNHVDWHVFGFTVEEKKRHEGFVIRERSNVIPVLINDNLTKQDCFDIIINAGIELPLAYRLGFPNANCIGCGKATSPTYWNHVRLHRPDVFESRAKLSRKIGAKLVRVKGKRIQLDELPPDAKGRPLKSLKMPECGIICEEKW